MDDKMLSWDCLKDQKHLVSTYAQISTELVCGELLSDTMKICQDEMRANHDIFNIMNQKGWYPVQAADAQKISSAKNKADQLSQSISQ